jgi:uncharacterized protein (DUF1778 family)
MLYYMETSRKKTERIELRISKELKDTLTNLANKARRKLSDYLRIVLEDHSRKENKRK